MFILLNDISEQNSLYRSQQQMGKKPPAAEGKYIYLYILNVRIKQKTATGINVNILMEKASKNKLIRKK